MKKFTPFILIAWFTLPAMAQSARFDNLENISRIIISGNVTEIRIQEGGSSITLDGIAKDQVTFEYHAGIVSLQFPDSPSVTAIISASGLRWIDAGANTKIFGAEYLKGGNGKFLVVNLTGRDGPNHKYKYKYEYAFDKDAIDVKIGNFNFDFDKNFDFDFDFDINADFDWDWDWDWDWDDHH